MGFGFLVGGTSVLASDWSSSRLCLVPVAALAGLFPAISGAPLSISSSSLSPLLSSFLTSTSPGMSGGTESAFPYVMDACSNTYQLFPLKSWIESKIRWCNGYKFALVLSVGDDVILLCSQFQATLSLLRSVALVQSLSSRILVTRGNRMEMPSAVWAVERVNSAPVISHTGANCMYVCTCGLIFR